jgi:histidinol phosphatase-like PHP family hydrolase
LDLHTHCQEATGYAAPTPQIVEKILDRCVARGLDGLAITEHWSSRYAYQVKEVVATHFPDCPLIILPGKEVDVGPRQVVELYLPNETTFRFWAHPEFWVVDARPDIRGIEIENGMHHINKERVREIATEQGLKLLKNSDAHYLDDIGRYYNEIEWEELLSLGVP